MKHAWQLLAVIMLLALGASIALAANDPGHDTLYVLRLGDTNVSGSINLTGNMTAQLVRVSSRFFGDNLDIRADGSATTAQNFIKATATDLEIGSGSRIILNGGGTAVQVGTVAAPANLNVTGSIYAGGTLVCLSDGTNCPGGSNTGNVSSISAGNGISVSGTTGDVTISTSATSCGAGEYSYWDGDSWECRADESTGDGTGGWSDTPSTVTLVDNTDNVTIGAIPTFFVDNTNIRVGMGTTTPQNRLHITPTTGRTTEGLQIGSANDQFVILGADFGVGNLNPLTLDGDGGIFFSNGTKESGSFIIAPWSDSTSGLRITSTGNVGIGSLVPTQKLHVNGSANITGTIYQDNVAVCLSNGTNCPVTAGGAGNITGDGTADYLVKWTNNTHVTRSIISESGNTLTINGNISMPGNFYIGSGASSKGSNSIAIGSSADATNTSAIAIGFFSDATTENAVAIGYSAQATKIGTTTVGSQAGFINSGQYLTALGSSAGSWNAGNTSIAIGINAGTQNTANDVSAIGPVAGAYNDGNDLIAIGRQAGYYNDGNDTVAIGYQAGTYNLNDGLTAIGTQAGFYNNGTHTTAIGYRAGYENNGNRAIAIGYESARGNNGSDVVAIGYEAGENNIAPNQFILKQNNINAMPLIQGNFSSGNVGIGTTAPTQKLTVNGSANITGTIYQNSVAVCLSNGTNCPSASGAGNTTGTGTANTLAYWVNNTHLGSSIISQSGTTATIAGNLTITGTNINTPSTFAIGQSAIANGSVTIAIGSNAQATGPSTNSGSAFGAYARAVGQDATALASFSYAGGVGDLAIGRAANATAGYAIAIGYQSKSTGNSAIAAGTYSYATSNQATALGMNSYASQTGATALGASTNATGLYTIAVGYQAQALLSGAVAQGFQAKASGARAIANGYQANASHTDSIALGRSATTTAANQLMVGSSSYNLDTYIYGGLTVNTGEDICITGGNCLAAIASDNTTWNETRANALYYPLGSNPSSYLTSVPYQSSAAGWINTSTTVYTADITDNIAIGTFVASQKLHVQGSINVTDTAYLNTVQTLKINTGKDGVQISQYDTPDDTVFSIYTGGENYIDSLGLPLNFISATDYKFTNDPTGKFLISNSTDTQLFVNGSTGKVGIGTATPGFKLQVGSGTTTGINANTHMLVTDPDYARMGIAVNGAGIFFGASTDNTKASMFVYDYNWGAPRDLILNEYGGKVGIGTTTPKQALDVAGSVNVTGNISTTTNNGMCFNENCSARIYYNGTALVIQG